MYAILLCRPSGFQPVGNQAPAGSLGDVVRDYGSMDLSGTDWLTD